MVALLTAGLAKAALYAEMACAGQPRKASLWATRGGGLSGARRAAWHLKSLFRHITTLFYGLG